MEPGRHDRAEARVLCQANEHTIDLAWRAILHNIEGTDIRPKEIAGSGQHPLLPPLDSSRARPRFCTTDQSAGEDQQVTTTTITSVPSCPNVPNPEDSLIPGPTSVLGSEDFCDSTLLIRSRGKLIAHLLSRVRKDRIARAAENERC